MGKKILLFLGVAMLLSIACSKEVTVTEDPQSPVVTPASATVGAAAGTSVFELREAITDLTIKSNQTWCTPTVEGGGNPFV